MLSAWTGPAFRQAGARQVCVHGEVESMKAVLEENNTKLLAVFQERLAALYAAALADAAGEARTLDTPSHPAAAGGVDEAGVGHAVFSAANPRPSSAFRPTSAARPSSAFRPTSRQSVGQRPPFFFKPPPEARCTDRPPPSREGPQGNMVVPFAERTDHPEASSFRVAPIDTSGRESTSTSLRGTANGFGSAECDLPFFKKGPTSPSQRAETKQAWQGRPSFRQKSGTEDLNWEDFSREGAPSSANLMYQRQLTCLSEGPKSTSIGSGVIRDPRVFQDVTELKQRVRQTLVQPEYNVASLYHDTGFWQAVARHKLFDTGMLWVILLNTLWTAVDTDLNNADYVLQAPAYAQVVEHIFTVLMTGEVVVRFCAFKSKSIAMRDRSFIFDSSLVAFQIFETWIMTFVILVFLQKNGDEGNYGISNTSVLRIFRLMRIFRMARVARLLSAAPELLVLVKGVVSASRSVFLTLCLLFVVLFIFSVGLRQITKDTDLGEQYFGSIFDSMFSLFVYGTIPDQAGIIVDATNQQPMFGLVVLLYVFVAFLTVLNLLVGVIVQVVNVVSAVENEEIAVKDVRRRLMAAVENNVDSGWEGETTVLSRDDFQFLVTQPDIVRALASLRVDCVALLESEDIIFSTTSLSGGFPEPVESISFGEFMEVVMQMRGSNQATVKDMVQLRKYVQVTVTAAVGELLEALAPKSRARVQRYRSSTMVQQVRAEKGGGRCDHDSSDSPP